MVYHFFKALIVQLWPILERIREFRQLGPFVIALFFWYRTSEPSSVDKFIQAFVAVTM